LALTRLFGTDGVRGVANEDLTPELGFQLGLAATWVLGQRVQGRPRLIVGRDTRSSGDMLEAALMAGICAAGGEACRLGVFTTPGVAYLVRAMEAVGGVMISASHNPAEYNGYKFFSAAGTKLPDDLEEEIERLATAGAGDIARPTGTGVGRVCDDGRARQAYIDFLQGTVNVSFEGLKLVIDCAHGSACDFVRPVFEGLGAGVTLLGAAPDGVNINDGCGSTSPEALQAVVKERAGAVGLAFDGDADRVIAVDETGALVDGDQIMAVCAQAMHRARRLRGGAVAATVMSNAGLDVFLRDYGLALIRTQVGDRYVAEAMEQYGLNLGGEQSGHIIFGEMSTTGDGLLTSLQLLAVVQASGEPLSRLAAMMPRLPQSLVNVPVRDKRGLADNARVDEALAAARAEVEPNGRVHVRPSGTEPLIRVLVEGEDEGHVRRVAERVAGVIREELGD